MVAGLTVCALAGEGTVWCWGAGNGGQLGDGLDEHEYCDRDSPTQCSTTPVRVAGITDAWKIEGGGNRCAFTTSGETLCWGNNTFGQLGTGFVGGPQNTPVPLTLVSAPVSLSLGDSHSCAVLEDGSVWCWGNNDVGQLGNGSFDNDAHATASQVGELSDVRRVTVGMRHTCALTEDGAVW